MFETRSLIVKYLEALMSKKTNRIPPALKHGCYSGLTLLPTEDQTAFDKLHRDLIDEYHPEGRSEEMIIAKLAHLMWRSENLAIYRFAEHARDLHSSIYSKLHPPSKWEMPLMIQPEVETRSPEELKTLRKEADQQVQRELGPALELVEIGSVAEPDHLLAEMSLIERLEGMIARCLKQLLLVRGVKSMSLSGSTESSQPRTKRVA
jgi:hypothetical protein